MAQGSHIAKRTVNARNARFPDAKPWKVKVTDVNQDGDSEVLILDGEGNVRYVNGWQHTHTVCVPYYKAAPYNISHTKKFSRAK